VTCFDRTIRRAIELRRAGYDTNQIAQMIFPACEGSLTSARLVARAAKVFVNGERRNSRLKRGLVQWLN
jgi:hypothetical protein